MGSYLLVFTVAILTCIVEREQKWKSFAFQNYHVYKLTVMLAGLLKLTGLYVNDQPQN